MPESESLNYLLGNFVTQDNDIIDLDNNIKSGGNMVCIDTSNGFLGFNTIDPSYHIDVSGGTIRTDNLILNNIILGSSGLPINSIYRTDSGTLKIKTE